MRKFLPGGRCGGSTPGVKEDTQGVTASFNSLLAQRETQIAQMFQNQNQNKQIPFTLRVDTAEPALTQIQQTQIVVVQPKEEKKVSKYQIINTILNGDY